MNTVWTQYSPLSHPDKTHGKLRSDRPPALALRRTEPRLITVASRVRSSPDRSPLTLPMPDKVLSRDVRRRIFRPPHGSEPVRAATTAKLTG